MSLQMETPGGGLGAFWAKVTGGARRQQPARPRSVMAGDAGRRCEPQPMHSRRDSAATTSPLQQKPDPISDERAAGAQEKRRGEIRADELFRFWVSHIRSGDYAYRILKSEFDENCTEAKIAPVSDRQMAIWLQAHGGVKYRTGKQKITMYKMPRRQRAAA